MISVYTETEESACIDSEYSVVVSYLSSSFFSCFKNSFDSSCSFDCKFSYTHNVSIKLVSKAGIEPTGENGTWAFLAPVMVNDSNVPEPLLSWQPAVPLPFYNRSNITIILGIKKCLGNYF
jgi:hypothetical protein